MKVSNKGLEIIKKHEGLRLKPYLCPAGIPTIGYGNTYYENGLKVKLSDVPITNQRAEELLIIIVDRFSKGVEKLLTRPVNQNQFDALVSFAYNLGVNALKTSTLLKRVNANPCDEDIKYQFSRWNKANGIVLNGLTKRRKEESDLYFE